jgi:hypothetical protein
MPQNAAPRSGLQAGGTRLISGTAMASKSGRMVPVSTIWLLSSPGGTSVGAAQSQADQRFKAKTIGIVWVAVLAARAAGVAMAKMTSG